MSYTALEELEEDGAVWLESNPHGDRYATSDEDSVWVCRVCGALLEDSDAPCPHCHDADDDDAESEDWS